MTSKSCPKRTSLGTCLILAALLPLVSTGMVLGQGLSTIRGTVLDNSKSMVPGASITITESLTNVVARSLVSDENGNFEAPGLKVGTYQIKVELTGFKTTLVEQVVLESSQIRRVEVILPVGEVNEQVTVEAGRAVITTDSAEIASGFKEELFQASPLVKTYYPQSLMATMPGIDSQGGGYALRMFGQPSTQVSEGMDGITEDGTVNLINNMLDFTELKIVAVNAPADQARIGNFNMVSKTGSNTIHGSVFYRHFNSALAARNFFAPTKTSSKEHIFHGDVSGPIIKDKTFFYVSLFYQRIPGGSFNRGTVATDKMRQGDFSQITKQLVDPLTGQPFTGNIIPAGRLNQTSLKTQELYIAPANLGGPDALVNNIGFTHGYPDDLFRAVYPMIRIDHTFNEKNSIYGRYIQRKTPYVLKGGLPGFDWTRERDHKGLAINDTHIFTPQIVNTFRFGWLSDYVVDGGEVDGFTPRSANEVVQAIGLQGVNPKGVDFAGFPQMSISGFTTLTATFGGVAEDNHQLNFSESLSWAAGKHVWKFGADLKRISLFNGKPPVGTFGNFSFDGGFTGNSYADFLLGLPRSSVRIDPLLDRTQLAYEFGAFVTDTFKVNQKLTLDYGIRWDYFSPGTYNDRLMYNWDPDTGNVMVLPEAIDRVSPLFDPRINVVTGEVIPNADMKNFAPRLGVAYRLREATVIRGGYGIYTEQRGYFADTQGGGPFSISESYTNSIVNGVPLFAFPNPFPQNIASAAIPSQSVSGYPLDTENGMIHQFNLSIEQEIRSIGFRASYVGSRSRGLNYSLNINKPEPSTIPFTDARRPFPEVRGASIRLSDGASNYDSIQFQVQRRVGWFTFDTHYTNQSNRSNFLNLENPYDHYYWNREMYSPRHKFVVNTTIDLPVGQGRRYLSDAHPVVDHILGGWKLITMSQFQSGNYFNPSFSGSDPSNTNSFGGLPDRIADGNIDDPSVDLWFNPGAFKVPEPGRFGNSGVNILEGPGINLHHLSIVKNFRITERFNLEFFTGVSNLFNRPHFNFPRTEITAQNPGVITSARNSNQDQNKAGERLVESTLKLKW